MNTATELAASLDQYKTICISNTHITESDAAKLRMAGDCPFQGMVLSRDTGFFVKFYCDDIVLEHVLPGYSEAFYNVMKQAQEAGFTLVELDNDGTVYSTLPTFDW